MKKAIRDTLHYIRECTVDMSGEEYAMYLEQLKDELSHMQFLLEWTDSDE